MHYPGLYCDVRNTPQYAVLQKINRCVTMNFHTWTLLDQARATCVVFKYINIAVQNRLVCTHRERRAAVAAAAAVPAVRVCCCCRKRRTRRRRLLASEEAARRTRCCTEHRGGDDGDDAGDVTAVDGDPRPTSRAVACWTVRSVARTTDAVLPVPATRTMCRRVVVRPSVNGKNKFI